MIIREWSSPLSITPFPHIVSHPSPFLFFPTPAQISLVISQSYSVSVVVTYSFPFPISSTYHPSNFVFIIHVYSPNHFPSLTTSHSLIISTYPHFLFPLVPIHFQSPTILWVQLDTKSLLFFLFSQFHLGHCHLFYNVSNYVTLLQGHKKLALFWPLLSLFNPIIA